MKLNFWRMRAERFNMQGFNYFRWFHSGVFIVPDKPTLDVVLLMSERAF